MWNMLMQVSIVKSIIFNLKYFGLKGVFYQYAVVSRHAVLKSLKGKVILRSPHRHCLRIGFGHNEVLDNKYERAIFYNTGTIVVLGEAHLNQGFRVFNKGVIYFGDSFVVTGNSKLICMNEVRFGEDCLLSWGVTIMDTDFHKILSVDDQFRLNSDASISIGAHCWICANTTILKGAVVSDNCVVASGSIVSKKFYENNVIISSNKILRKDINWEH